MLPPELVMVMMTMIAVTPTRARQHPPTRRGWSFTDCLIFIIINDDGEVSQLNVYQTNVLPLYTLYFTINIYQTAVVMMNAV